MFLQCHQICPHFSTRDISETYASMFNLINCLTVTFAKYLILKFMRSSLTFEIVQNISKKRGTLDFKNSNL